MYDCLFVYLFDCLFVWLSICLIFYLSDCLFVCLFVRLSICMIVCLSFFFYMSFALLYCYICIKSYFQLRASRRELMNEKSVKKFAKKRTEYFLFSVSWTGRVKIIQTETGQSGNRMSGAIFLILNGKWMISKTLYFMMQNPVHTLLLFVNDIQKCC